MADVQNSTRLLSAFARLEKYKSVAVTFTAVLIFIIGIVVLHRLATEISWHMVKTDISSLPWPVLAFSLVCTAVSYTAFSLYDVLSLQHAAPGKVPARVAMMAGAAGYAVSNLLGFSYITGPAVRSRIYSAYRVDLAVIVGVIASIWFFFWVGVFLLIGAMLLLHPTGIPALEELSPLLQKSIALVILASVAGLLIALSRGVRTLTFKSISIPLPGFRPAVMQIGIGMVDIGASALALYVLLPGDIVTTFPLFFVVYVGAIALGILSHSPGGLGVFEATIIAGLGATGRSDVLAALVLYRVIYYVLPFAIAAFSLGIAWGLTNSKKVGRLGRQARSIIGAIIPAIASALTLIAGIMLLLSGNLPGESERLRTLETIVPLPVIEVSHLLASIIGVMLIVLARGLYRKQFKAWVFAVCLSCAGIVLSLSRGFDWEEALALTFTLFVLFMYRSAFYRSADQAVFLLSPRWALISFGVFGFSVWVGLFAYSHVEYNNDLWWRFAWNGDAPRYLRASLASGVVLAAIGLNTLINASARRLPPEPIPDSVRSVIASSGNSEAYVQLTGDKRFLVSPEGGAFIGYADTGSSLISKGDPIGDHQQGLGLIWKLRETADRLGKQCAFYAVWDDYLPTYLDMGCSILKIGEVARVPLADFSLDGAGKKDFRHARARAGREGYHFEIIRAADLEAVLPQLRLISDAWLDIKNGEEKAFALGRFDETYLRNFDHAILRHAESGRIVAFANLFQTTDHHELSLDLMRHDPAGPGFAMDALFGQLLVWGREQGFEWFSLGAAPFARLQSNRYATVWNRIGHYLYEHGDRFYHFEGLRSFKQKFDPVWSPNYLAVPRGASAPKILLEVNGLVSGGMRGLLK